MFEFFPAEVPLLVSSMILLIMGCVALVFSLALYKRFRSLAKFPRNVSASMFSKTFNVLDVSLGRRKIVGSHMGLVILLGVYGSWFAVTILVFKTFEVGGVLGAIALIACAGLLMIDETQDLHKNAGLFAKAVEGGTALGQGDVQALKFVRRAVPKLSLYHIVLAVVFFASSISVPYIVNASFAVLAWIAQGLLGLSAMLSSVPFISLVFIAGLFGTGLALFQIAVLRVRKRLFGFPMPIPVDIEERQLIKMKTYVKAYHHLWLRNPMPEDTEEERKKDLEEHGDKISVD